jgi:microcystin-dependent protein
VPDPTTTNLQLAVPAHLSDSGTWDSPVNGNFQIIDGIWGGVTSLSLNTANVTLSVPQWQQQILKLSGTIINDITITLPALGGHHIVMNAAIGSGSSDFVVILTTGAGRNIALPAGETVDIVCDSANVDFRNLGRVGSFIQHGGSVAPRWIGLCSIPPYLFCDGSAFSALTYPALARYLGTTTLPDTRGRTHFNLNSGTGRVTSGNSGVDGNTLFATGGDERAQQHSHLVTDPGHFHDVKFNRSGIGSISGPTVVTDIAGTDANTGPAAAVNATTNITINNQFSGNSQNMPPAYIGGLTFIRAA